MSCSVMVNLRVGWPWDTAFATIIDEYARDQGYHPSCYRLYAADRAVSRDMKLSAVTNHVCGFVLCHMNGLEDHAIHRVWERVCMCSGSFTAVESVTKDAVWKRLLFKAGGCKCQEIFWQNVVENIHIRTIIDLCAGLPTAMQARTTFPGDEAGPQSFSPNFTCQMHQDSAMPTHQCCICCSAQFLFQQLCFSTISV